MNETAKTITDAKLKQRQIDRAIADLRKQLDAAGGKIETRTQVRIFVSAAAPLEAELKLRYQVENASWSAFYDARLATGDQGKGVNPSLAIIRRATIQQKSGEDWDDVALALSTTRPGRATAARQPEMLSIDFAPDAAANPRASQHRKRCPGRIANAVSAPATAAAERPAAVAETSAFQTVYAIPGRISIRANGEAKRLQLGSENFDPSLLVLTVPRFDLTAYLYARLKLPKTSQPMLAGPVALFRDGVFAGNGELPQLAPGEEHELGFGADERVKVKQAVIDDKKGETGTFTTSRMEERHYAIAVRNLHARPIQLAHHRPRSGGDAPGHQGGLLHGQGAAALGQGRQRPAWRHAVGDENRGGRGKADRLRLPHHLSGGQGHHLSRTEPMGFRQGPGVPLRRQHALLKPCAYGRDGPPVCAGSPG